MSNLEDGHESFAADGNIAFNNSDAIFSITFLPNGQWPYVVNAIFLGKV